MSLGNFRTDFLDRLLDFLWRQWSALGVLGESGAEDDWVLDPEALLVFSLQIARYEPRLFDEILSWVVTNGSHLDAARLRNQVKGNPDTGRCLGAVLQYAIRHEKQRKWKNLAVFCGGLWKKQPQADSTEALFLTKAGEPYPFASVVGAQPDADFMMFFLDRRKIEHLREGHEVPINAKANLRFLLRSLFGIGSRSECLAYLLTHDGGEARMVAEEIGLFWLGVQQTLADMKDSGLVLARAKGKRKIEYWISHKRWWDFLAYSGQEITQPKWLDWGAIYPALWGLWQTVDALSRGAESDYMKASKLHDSLEILEREFTRAGYDLPRIPPTGAPPDLYQKTALQFLGQIFKVKTSVNIPPGGQLFYTPPPLEEGNK